MTSRHIYGPVREHFEGARLLSPVWTLTKGPRRPPCECWSHELGYHLRLTVTDDPLLRTHVCRDGQVLVAVQDEWRKALVRTTGNGQIAET